MITRRDFCQYGSLGVLSLLSTVPESAGQSQGDYRALVCVDLSGGNDANNMVIPMDDARYGQYIATRQHLALTGRSITTPIQGADGSVVSFHSSLAELAALFASKKLAIIGNVGPVARPLTKAQFIANPDDIPHHLYSHPDQQLLWQTAKVTPETPLAGWGGRYADYIKVAGTNSGTLPSFVDTSLPNYQGKGLVTSPLSVNPRNSTEVTIFESGPGKSGVRAAFDEVLSSPSPSTLTTAAKRIISMGLRSFGDMSTAVSKAPRLRTKFPATPLGEGLLQIARLMQVRSALGMSRQLFRVSHSGFDTHEHQLQVQAELFSQLNNALMSFYEATVELGIENQVVTFTQSEFGRTMAPTQSGSDHGWGGHQLVLGGSVKGGTMVGSFPSFELGGPDDADARGRWIPSLSVSQYVGTLGAWFGIPESRLVEYIPLLSNFSQKKLGFL